MNHNQPLFLTPHQSAQLKVFVAKNKEDNDLAELCGEKRIEIHELTPFPCKVPGMVAVRSENDFVLKLLYPTPGTHNHDPQFQHAQDIDRELDLIPKPFLYGRREFCCDWQWESGMLMDAPDRMPAGACHYFCYEDDVYGATQFETNREERAI